MTKSEIDARFMTAVAVPAPWSFRVVARLMYLAGATWVRAAQISKATTATRSSATVLVVESGERGWGLLEFQELWSSAVEFFGADGVRRVTIVSARSYLTDVRTCLNDASATHYLYDPRSGAQGWWRAMAQSFAVASLLARRGITPVARLCDFPLRRHRLQCAVVTACHGIILIGISPPDVRTFLPHRRVLGPVMMPLSESRLQNLRERRDQRIDPNRGRALFNGTLYEPRGTILDAVQADVRERDCELEVQTRQLGSARESVESIWEQYLGTEVFFTTAAPSNEPGTDRVGLPHLTYRYTEALAAGALLVAPAVPGADALFRPGIDFAAYSSVAEAADEIARYVLDPELRRKMASAGRERVTELVRSQHFWREIDASLGGRGFVDAAR